MNELLEMEEVEKEEIEIAPAFYNFISKISKIFLKFI